MEKKLFVKMEEIEIELRQFNEDMAAILLERPVLNHVHRGMIERRLDRLGKELTNFEILLLNNETNSGEEKSGEIRGGISDAYEKLKKTVLLVGKEYSWQRLLEESGHFS